MEIVRRNQKDPVHFEDLSEGDLFLGKENEVYMKIHSFAEGDPNAVDLDDGSVSEFHAAAMVIPIKGKLVLEA